MSVTTTVGITDLSAKVQVESIVLRQTARSGGVIATASFMVMDSDASESIAPEDAVVIVDGETTYFKGEVAGTPERWEPGPGKLIWRVEAQDYNKLLAETVVDSATYAVGTTSDADIIDGIVTDARGEADIDSTTHVTEVVAAADMEAFAVEAVSLSEALTQLCGVTGARFYLDFDKNLYYFATSTNNAAFGLSDSYDGEDTFRYWGLRRLPDTGIVNAVYVVGKEIVGWRTNADSVTAYGSREIAIKDNDISTSDALNQRGDAILSANKDPRATYELCTEKGGLVAGMNVELTSSVHGLTAENLFILSVETTFLTGSKPIYKLTLGDDLFTAQSAAAVDYGNIGNIAKTVGTINDEVFDTDAPATPAFEAGNLATGVHLELDGTQNVYVTMTWGSVEAADLDHYEAQLSTASDFTSGIYTRYEPGTGDRLCLWEFLQGNTVYYARVRSVDRAGNASAWAGTQNITSSQDSSAPAQVTGLVVAGARSLFGLDWDDNSEADRAYYEIQRDTDDGGSPAGDWATVGVARTSHYVDQGFSEAQIQASTVFHYKVRCVDTSENAGDYSDSDSDNLDPLGSDSIAANAIIAVKIAANAVEADKINAGAVTTAKLDAGAVTVAKLDVVVGGYNLLINSGINDDDDGDGVPDEWTESTDITNHANTLDPTYKVVGASSFHVGVAAGDTSGDKYDLYQDITLANVPLAIGDDFVLSAYILTSAISDLRTTVFVRWLDAESAGIRDDLLSWVTANQGWTRDTTTNTVPATSVTARVVFRVELTADNGTGHVYVDAIKLERGDVPTSWTTGMIGNVTIDSNRVQVVDSDAKVWLGKRGASLGMWGENADGDLQVGWYASGDNAGAVVAGAGDLLLDANGVSLQVAVDEGNTRRYKFITSAGALRSYLGASETPNNNMYMQVMPVAEEASGLFIHSLAPETYQAQLELSAFSDVTETRILLVADSNGTSSVSINRDTIVTLDIRVGGGLYVGGVGVDPAQGTITATGAIGGASLAATAGITAGTTIAATGAISGASAAITGALTGASLATTGGIATDTTFALTDGIAAPDVIEGMAVIYVDTADGNLKVKFADGFVQTIATDD